MGDVWLFCTTVVDSCHCDFILLALCGWPAAADDRDQRLKVIKKQKI